MWRWLLRILFLLVGSCFFISIGLYIYASSLVANRFERTVASVGGAIYYAPETFYSQNASAVPQLEDALHLRGYKRVDQRPEQPGSFFRARAQFEIYTREFSTANGAVVPAQIKVVDLSDGNSSQSVTLEPTRLGSLTGQDSRQSSYRKVEQVPMILQNLVIAIEDQRFALHHGLDVVGILRAAAVNLRAGKIVQGGSTLTQQLAKNTLLTRERTFRRKIIEAFAALAIESKFSKEEILEMYLNEVYLGQNGTVAIHGMAAAAEDFFGKGLTELTIAESALLAGIIRAPSYYSPRRHRKRASQRRKVVLDKALRLKYISKSEYQKANGSSIRLAPPRIVKHRAPFFTSALIRNLAEENNMSSLFLSEMSVQTGLNQHYQRCGEYVLRDQLEELERKYPQLRKRGAELEGSLVAIEPHSGLVTTWVGGRNYKDNQFDHVSQASRQIGSTIKPFLYLTVLDKGLNVYRGATAQTILSDRPLEIPLKNGTTWRPQNYDKQYRGDVTLRYALERSLNVPAAFVANKIGTDTLRQTLQRFRLARSIPSVPAIALGAVDTSLLNLTAAYGVLANGGIYTKPRLYVSALSNDGTIKLTSEIEEQRIADESAVYVLTNLLQGVIERGTGKVVRSLGFEPPAAGKTGTSSNSRDSWFVGYTPNLVTGVWVGFDNNAEINLSGSQAAAPIWAKFMKCIDPYHEDLDFIKPQLVEIVPIDRISGGKATENCPTQDVIEEVFVRGTEPDKFCSLHGGRQKTRNSNRVRAKPTPKKAYPKRSPPKKRDNERGIWRYLFGR